MLVDGHVHIYENFNIFEVLTSAYRNFTSQIRAPGKSVPFCAGTLLFAEIDYENGVHGLGRVQQRLSQSQTSARNSEWYLEASNEPGTWFADHPDGKRLCLMAGRQITTAEDLEILALATSRTFPNGGPFLEVLETVMDSDAIPVIPWGVGKWIGKRGRLVREAITQYSPGRFFLGDNSGRPRFWKTPQLFRLAEQRGIGILPGSDPLPLPDGYKKVGSFGFDLATDMDADLTSKKLGRILLNKKLSYEPFGLLEKCPIFFLSQIKMQIRKRARQFL